MWTCCSQSTLVMFQHHAFANSVHFQHPCIFSPVYLFSSEFYCLWFSCYFFLLQGWFSVVRQHCWGKPCRLITLDSHKLNATGLQIHIKVPDGCERWQQTRAWFACHSVTFALFTFLINAERHIYQMTGRDGRWEGGKKIKQPSLRGGKGENGEYENIKVIHNESQNGEMEKEN